ncbi:flagellar motor protein PomA [bacterium J17]|nr:flagellar motor protein PomA [bacterium J17]
MDLATLVGFIGAVACISSAILLGGSAGMFFNIPSLLIVVGGGFAVVLMKFPLSLTLGSFKIAARAFLHKSETPTELIEVGMELANIARKDGVLGLEKVEISNEFLAKGIQLVVDGQEPDMVRKILTNDINLAIERHDQGQNVFKAFGDSAPAMGMIGTLVGLVQMMSNMEDPKSIGPAMAVALLTTLYGAIIANAMMLPIADKLGFRSTEERINKSLVLETVNAIQNGVNPRILEDLLRTYLPGRMQGQDGNE